MKKKIAFVCPRSPREDYAGIENYVLNLTKELKKFYDIEIFCTAKNPTKGARINGIPLLEFKEEKMPFGIHYYSNELISSLKKSNADIIHACGYNTMAPLMSLIAKKREQKLVITLASSKSSSPVRELLENAHSVLIKALSKKVDCFIAISRFEKSIFEKKFNNRFCIIPVAHNRLKLGYVPKKEKQVITIGRLTKNKGFHFVIDAFNELIKMDGKFNLVIVGDGPYKDTLQKQVETYNLLDKVKFTGMIPRQNYKKLLRLLKESTAFVFLSSYDSPALIVEEAIFTKTPTIVANTSAIKEFAECKLATAFEQTESRKIAEKIIEISKNPKKFEPKEKDIKNCYLIKNWAEVRDQTIKVYNTVLKEKN